MKLMLKKVFVYLLIGVIYMFSYYGCSSGLKYERYSSKDSKINITLDYVSGWLYSEHRGSQGSYAQVLFYEPTRKNKDFKAGMVVTVKDSSKIEVNPLSVEAVADDLLAKRLKLKDAKVLLKSKIRFFKTDAINVELSYKTLDKLYSVNAELIPVRERIVIFKRGDKFYFLRYENTDDEFDKFSKAFNHIIKTLRFKHI